MAKDDDFFGTTLCFASRLPLAFHALDAALPAAALAQINAQNQQVLHADASIDESHRPVDAKDEERPWLADITRLEYKLDVLMGLVGRLLARDASMPATTSVQLYAGGIEWLAQDVPPAVGSAGVLTVYVNPSFPQPLQLPGVVVSHRAGEKGTWAQFEFQGQSAAVVDLLEKLVFRHHRRQVAEARAAG
jgi:hypothetical protein